MTIRKKARKAMREERFAEAASLFVQLASEFPNEIDAYLQAARCYQQAGDKDLAADWFLKTAKIYIQAGIGLQSVALLRIYRDLRPDDGATCRELFRQCRTQTSEPEELVDMLDDDDKARYTMRYGDIFSALDDTSFDALLDDMEVCELQADEVLLRAGDPADALFLIAEGCLQAWMTKDGQRVSLGRIAVGGVCGEVPLFTGLKRRTGDLIACMPTRVVKIHYGLLGDLQKENNTIRQRIDSLYQRHLLERHLALSPFFGSLNAELRQSIAVTVRPVRLRAGGLLFAQDDSGYDIYQLRSGLLNVDVKVDGQVKRIKQIKPGGVVGEIAIANDGKRTATIRAEEDSILLRWSAEGVQAAYRQHEELRESISQRKKHWAEQVSQCLKTNTTLIEDAAGLY